MCLWCVYSVSIRSKLYIFLILGIKKAPKNRGFLKINFLLIISLRTNYIIFYHFLSSSKVLYIKAFSHFKVTYLFVIFNINKHYQTSNKHHFKFNATKSAIFFLLLSNTSEYILAVTETSLCPKFSDTSFKSTPAFINSVAFAWRSL